MSDPQAILSANLGQAAPLLIGHESIHRPQGWAKVNIFHMDDTNSYTPISNQNVNFGDTVRFSIQKRATLVGPLRLIVDISAGVLDQNHSPVGPGIGAAYVNNLGDQLLREVRMRYGSNIIQTYPGHFQYMVQRIGVHDNHNEPRHAAMLGGLGPAQEQARIDALITPDPNNFTDGNLRLYIWLDELYQWHHPDEFLMPESLATNVEIEIVLEQLQNLVYSHDAVDPFAAAGGVRPAIQSITLMPHEVTLPYPEKARRLDVFGREDGQIIKFLDLEQQSAFPLQGTGTANLRTFRVPLDNIRLDMAELIFWVRHDRNTAAATAPGINAAWAGDATEHDPTLTAVLGVNTACNVPVRRFRLEANGKRLFEDQDELYNRCTVRKMYHHDCQVGGFIYIVSFAKLPEDRKNVTSFANAANLGKMELVIEMADWVATYQRLVDVYSHSHNFIQCRRGDMVKTLK